MPIIQIVRNTVIGSVLGLIAPTAVHAENFARGQELYEHHCSACHHDLAFGGEGRKVRTADDLRKRIVGWAAHTGQDWGRSEVEDVLFYLNRSFYHFKDK